MHVNISLPIAATRSPALLGFSFCIIINLFKAVVTFFKYDIKKLIMMQKLEPKTADPKSTEI